MPIYQMAPPPEVPPATETPEVQEAVPKKRKPRAKQSDNS